MTAHFLLERIVVGRGFFFGVGRYRKKAGQEKEAAKKRCVVRTSLKADGAALFTTTHKKAHVHGRPN